MLVSNFESWSLGILAILVLVSLILLHFLLFRTYFQKEKNTHSKLKELQNLVNLQIDRSNSLSLNPDFLQKEKDEAVEKLEVIRLQVEAMKKAEGIPISFPGII